MIDIEVLAVFWGELYRSLTEDHGWAPLDAMTVMVDAARYMGETR